MKKTCPQIQQESPMLSYWTSRLQVENFSWYFSVPVDFLHDRQGGFNFISPKQLPPSSNVSLSFASLNPGIVFSSRLMYIFSGIFFPEKACLVYIKNLLRDITFLINYFFDCLGEFFGCCIIGACWFTAYRHMMQVGLFFEAMKPSMTCSKFSILSTFSSLSLQVI